MGAKRLVAAAGVSAAATACSMFLSSEEFAGGDAHPSAADAGDAPATGDGGTSAGGADVAQTDAAPSGPFCASILTRPTFCADFDGVTNATDGWSWSGRHGPTTLELDRSAFVSSPASVRLGVGGGIPGTGDGYVSRLAFDVASGTKKIHVQTKLRIDDVDAVTPTYLVWFAFTAGATYLRASRNEASVLQQSDLGNKPTPLARAVDVNRWSTLDVELLGGAPPRISVSIDGQPALATTPLDATMDVSTLTSVSFGAGYFTVAGVQATQLHYDDIRIDRE